MKKMNLFLLLLFLIIMCIATNSCSKKDNQEARNKYEEGQHKLLDNGYYEAISDFTKAIELRPDYDSAYVDRGFVKFVLHDYSGAISDFTKAIEITPDFSKAYFYRGLAKDGAACEDFFKAKTLGEPGAENMINRNCK